MAPNVPREPSSPPSHPRSGLAGRRERGSLFASASPKEVRKRGAQVRKVVAPHKPGCVLFDGGLAGARRASPPPSSEGSRRQGKGKRAPTGRPGCPSSAISCPGRARANGRPGLCLVRRAAALQSTVRRRACSFPAAASEATGWALRAGRQGPAPPARPVPFTQNARYSRADWVRSHETAGLGNFPQGCRGRFCRQEVPVLRAQGEGCGGPIRKEE